ncbi:MULTISPECIES: acyl-CoA thioesterase [Pedobacter]|uniref:Thioesterase-like protein n=1 Tax=Pedobacter heparinus (strain ATCC 13125 / DSM 2366 / CIP 104194 / JCM 7457 / NBRC 12017 / NCIMB 9290 / NRRL B-14731 / HIM 762-3) TaxID=485917 RepID=C6XZI4_PEDHD|nr:MULTISPECIES: thioesterase family protein [Pedobacter]ACU04680.1 thioesterase-like protein [Pedobacter heparinus DSM 2366]MBB5437469.1 acyl-CoA thioester hydrolase [Pedobacter sp. AK017]
MKHIQLRWADLDPNFHLRHSSYYDLAAQERIDILDAYGITLQLMKTENVGPVLFKEQCEFRREIHLGTKIHIVTSLLKMKRDGSRWIIQHEFLSEEGKLHALIQVEGSWMDTVKRKLARPVPVAIFEGLEKFPKTPDFEYL